MTVSGLRSSWLALATKRAWRSNARGRRAQLAPGERPAERGREQRRAGQRDEELDGELRQRRLRLGTE